MNNDNNGLVFDNDNTNDTNEQNSINTKNQQEINNITIDYNSLYTNQLKNAQPSNIENTNSTANIGENTTNNIENPLSEESTSTPLENEKIENNNDSQINNKGTLIFVIIVFILVFVAIIFLFPYLFKKTF